MLDIILFVFFSTMSIIKKIQLCLLVLVFLFVVLQFWASDYNNIFNSNPVSYHHLPDTSKTFTIPRIQIHFKDIGEDTEPHNEETSKDMHKTETTTRLYVTTSYDHDVSLPADQALSSTTVPEIKLTQYTTTVMKLHLSHQKPTFRFNETNIEENSTIKTSSVLSHFNVNFNITKKPLIIVRNSMLESEKQNNKSVKFRTTSSVMEMLVASDKTASVASKMSVTLDKLKNHGVSQTKSTNKPNTTSADKLGPTYGPDFKMTTSSVNETTFNSKILVVHETSERPVVYTTAVALRMTTSSVPKVSIAPSPSLKEKEVDKWSKYPYPLDVNMVKLVTELKSNRTVGVKPVFPYNYSYSFRRKDWCGKHKPFFIFLIKSAIGNIDSRSAIRQTWAQTKLQRKYNFEKFFFVGSSENKTDMTAVGRETIKHKDVVQISFRENYYNNTLKTIGAIHWTVKYCNCAKFVVFVDDDIVVSTKQLNRFLVRKLTTGLTFYGGHINPQVPQRDKSNKWYVSEADYPHKEYPPMPSGGFLIMTMNFVVDLHYASQYTKKFIYDDCFLSILAYKLHVTPINLSNVYMWPVHQDLRRLRTSLAVHGDYSPDLLFHVWQLLRQG
ncbi:uncharacterized protein [Argopecten irradians]|uniref:uncharacterized protein n=1 Tax=Argopecten irradians TaxID=31199 RepID=UPI0037227CB5